MPIVSVSIAADAAAAAAAAAAWSSSCVPSGLGGCWVVVAVAAYAANSASLMASLRVRIGAECCRLVTSVGRSDT